MPSNKKHDTKSFRQYLSANKPQYKLISEFIGVGKLHTFKHVECGREFEEKPYKVYRQVMSCSHCRSEKSVGKRTTEEYKEELFKRHPDYILVSKEYTKLAADHKYKHSCGTVFVSTPWKLNYQKVPCPNCRKIGGTDGKRNEDTYKEYLATKFGDQYTLVSEFTTLKDKHTFKHTECGTEFEATPYALRKTKVPCPQCRGVVVGSQYTTDQYKVLLARKWGTEYTLQGEYTSGRDDHTYIHTSCGTEFVSRPYSMWKKEVPCTECCPPEKGVAKRRKILVGGKEFRVQGRENVALPFVWQSLGCDINDILTEKRDMPKLHYVMNGKQHRYYPDMFIPSRNLLIEVKDLSSLGLLPGSAFFGRDVFSRNCEKVRAAISMGFKIRLVLVAKGTCRVMPNGWFDWSTLEMNNWLLPYNVKLTTKGTHNGHY